jgi:hypothetical protein
LKLILVEVGRAILMLKYVFPAARVAAMLLEKIEKYLDEMNNKDSARRNQAARQILGGFAKAVREQIGAGAFNLPPLGDPGLRHRRRGS